MPFLKLKPLQLKPSVKKEEKLKKQLREFYRGHHDKPHDAIEALDKFLKKHEGHVEATIFYHTLLGKENNRAKNYVAAMTHFKAALEAFPNQHTDYCDLSYCWVLHSYAVTQYRTGAPYEEVLATFNQLSELDADESVYINRAAVHFAAQQYQKALSDYETALQLAPENYNAAFLRAHTLFELNKEHGLSNSQYRSILETLAHKDSRPGAEGSFIKVEYAAQLYFLGEAYLALQHYPLAEAQFNLALQNIYPAAATQNYASEADITLCAALSRLAQQTSSETDWETIQLASKRLESLSTHFLIMMAMACTFARDSQAYGMAKDIKRTVEARISNQGFSEAVDERWKALLKSLFVTKQNFTGRLFDKLHLPQQNTPANDRLTFSDIHIKI